MTGGLRSRTASAIRPPWTNHQARLSSGRDPVAHPLARLLSVRVPRGAVLVVANRPELLRLRIRAGELVLRACLLRLRGPHGRRGERERIMAVASGGVERADDSPLSRRLSAALQRDDLGVA